MAGAGAGVGVGAAAGAGAGADTGVIVGFIAFACEELPIMLASRACCSALKLSIQNPFRLLFAKILKIIPQKITIMQISVYRQAAPLFFENYLLSSEV